MRVDILALRKCKQNIINSHSSFFILQFDDFCSNFQITTHARGQPNNVLCMETISSSAREHWNRYIR